MEKIVRSEDFGVVYRNGKPYFGKYVVITLLPTDRSIVKVGYSVSKKIGNAVTRNLIKRRLKEIVRSMSSELKPGFYIVIGAKRSSPQASFQELKADIYRIMQGLQCFDRNIGGGELD